jgi:hypothetical protein
MYQTKRTHVFLLTVVLATSGLRGMESPAPSAQPLPSSLTAEEQPDGCLVREGESPVFFYQKSTKSQDGQFARAHYLHPLYDLDGNVLTEDFPKDHPHHRGVFWAWHLLSVAGQPAGDSWATENFSWNVQDLKIATPDPRCLELRVKVLWQSALGTTGGTPIPLVEETTAIRVHATKEDARKIDFRIRLLALREQMMIGGSDDDKGYGGFSARIRIPQDPQFQSRSGVVSPRVTAVEAGAWFDLSGDFDGSGRVSGVAILSHPSVPFFPPQWVVRRRPGMQNAVYPGRWPVALSATAPTELRYCLVIHRGNAQQARIEDLQTEYEGTP